jgi:hypothetical protein
MASEQGLLFFWDLKVQNIPSKATDILEVKSGDGEPRENAITKDFDVADVLVDEPVAEIEGDIGSVAAAVEETRDQ